MITMREVFSRQLVIDGKVVAVRPSVVFDASSLALTGRQVKKLLENPTVRSIQVFDVFLWDNAIDDVGFEALVDSPLSAKLQALWMGHNEITSYALCHLSHRLRYGVFKQIRDMFLDDNQIDDTGVVTLSTACGEHGHLPQLRRLGLHTNLITGLGASNVGRALLLGVWPQLNTLWLHNNRIECLGRLSAARKKRPSLQLTLQDNPVTGSS